MSSNQSEFPSKVRVECLRCGYFNQLGLRYAGDSVADYEGVCENDLEANGTCASALLVTVTLSEEIEEG